MDFKVILDKDVGRKVQGVVAFGDFETEDETLGTALYTDVGSFFLDLILGRPLPLTFVAREVETLGTVLAIALFLHRDLAIHPETPGFMACVNLADMGIAGLAHVDRDLSALFKFIKKYLSSAKKPRDALESVVGWVKDYITEKRLPALPVAPESPRILDIGTDGFVLATCGTTSSTHLADGWEELFRMGYLRGLLVKSVSEDRWLAVGAKKSRYLSFDLVKAAEVFNEAERALGEAPGWAAQDNWLVGPMDGTLLTVSAMTKVLVRA